MPLRTPVLDNRRFQDIVDEAKRLIPRYCPEWTDHNVSDPGIAMIELFAWMTEMMLYRINQVPEQNYVKFLELLGVKLDPPRSARAPVTFYLSAAQPNELTIPKGTEVATVRTETKPAIVFTTEQDLLIRPPVVLGASTRRAGDARWWKHDLKRLALPDQSISIFPDPPSPRDAFFIALEKDHSHHVLALALRCDSAGGAGVDPENPPIQWQVWQGGSVQWAPCGLEHDGTKGFNTDGTIVLHLPAMAVREIEGTQAYWLRCSLTDAQQNQPRYDLAPKLTAELSLEARGGTVSAHHAITVQDEVLGYSDGVSGASFKLFNSPILSRDEATDKLVVSLPEGPSARWKEVEDFGDSGPEDLHYTIDDLDGTITLGPSLLQPDGSVYRFGAVPPRGSLLSFSRYQYGGGVDGNVPRGALAVMKSSIPYVSYVSNREPAVGGLDAQSLPDAKLRVPRNLRTRSRAVTAGDYEYLACQVPGIARARCVAPGLQPADRTNPRPGQIVVYVLPCLQAPRLQLTPELLILSAEVGQRVRSYLMERSVLGSAVEVRLAQYIWITVQAKLRLAERSDPELTGQVRRQAEEALSRYLNPYEGGPKGQGWPFGRELTMSEIYSLLQRIPSVEFVDEVQIGISEPESGAPPRPAPARLTVPPQAVICSSEHHLIVSQ